MASSGCCPRPTHTHTHILMLAAALSLCAGCVPLLWLQGDHITNKATVVAQACCYSPEEEDEQHGDGEDGEGDGPEEGPAPKPYKGGSHGSTPGAYNPQGAAGFGGYAAQQSMGAAGATAPAATATPAAAGTQQSGAAFAQQGAAYRPPHMVG